MVITPYRNTTTIHGLYNGFNTKHEMEMINNSRKIWTPYISGSSVAWSQCHGCRMATGHNATGVAQSAHRYTMATQVIWPQRSYSLWPLISITQSAKWWTRCFRLHYLMLNHSLLSKWMDKTLVFKNIFICNENRAWPVETQTNLITLISAYSPRTAITQF